MNASHVIFVAVKSLVESATYPSLVTSTEGVCAYVCVHACTCACGCILTFPEMFIFRTCIFAGVILTFVELIGQLGVRSVLFIAKQKYTQLGVNYLTVALC